MESLVRDWRERGSAAAREAILARMNPLVRFAASRYSSARWPVADLEQEARLALLVAIDSYEEGRGVHFVTHGYQWILTGIRRYVRANGGLIREPAWLYESRIKLKRLSVRLEVEWGRKPTTEELAREARLSARRLAQALAPEIAVFSPSQARGAAEGDDDLFDTGFGGLIGVALPSPMRRIEQRVVLDEALATLDARHREAFLLRVGEEMSIVEIAQQLGVTQRRATSWINAAKRGLAAYLTKNGLDLEDFRGE
jgi:RNA polymerase sigma-B factor